MLARRMFVSPISSSSPFRRSPEYVAMKTQLLLTFTIMGVAIGSPLAQDGSGDGYRIQSPILVPSGIFSAPTVPPSPPPVPSQALPAPTPISSPGRPAPPSIPSPALPGPPSIPSQALPAPPPISSPALPGQPSIPSPALPAPPSISLAGRPAPPSVPSSVRPTDQLYSTPNQQQLQTEQELSATQELEKFSGSTFSDPVGSPAPPPLPSQMKGMPYEFEWNVNDIENGLVYGHQESSDGTVAQGEYRVLLPDGRLQIVTFEDRGQGYQAQVTYQAYNV
ncbi:formin-2-like [Macrobrachium nipponense]|uniref:formin-2-like n=1 Tax=Macrobrachium nipponense TaxID=159736 RepID=UPI0030C89983